MSTASVIGLGEPKLVGKKNLFQPPRGEDIRDRNLQTLHSKSGQDQPLHRVRTTIGLTNHALALIQEIQNKYRLETGRVLPLWKLVSVAIEFYAQSRKGDQQKKVESPNRGPDVSTTRRASLAQT
jgi:hypothetical protein